MFLFEKSCSTWPLGRSNSPNHIRNLQAIACRENNNLSSYNFQKEKKPSNGMKVKLTITNKMARK